MNRICWLDLAVETGMVYKNLVNSGIHRSLYIYFNTVADHNAFRRRGICFRKSIFKYLLIGLDAVTTFRGNNFNKIVCNSRIFQLTMLRFFKPIGDKVKFVPFVGEIIKTLNSVWEQQSSGRQRLKKTKAHIPCKFFISYFKFYKCIPHPLPA